MPLWTKEEIELLENNYAKKGTEWCSKKLDRKTGAITRKAAYLGIKAEHTWTDEETLYLIENSQKSLDFLTDQLNKSKKSIKGKISNLQINRSKKKINISDKEFKKIISLNKFDELAKELNVHFGILYKKILSIYPNFLINSGKEWEHDEDNYLTNQIGTYSRFHLGIKLKRSVEEVYIRIRVLGLQKSKKWDEEETKKLIKAQRNGFLEKFIKNSVRSQESINNKISIINQSNSTQKNVRKKHLRWTEDETKLLSEQYPIYGKEYCMKKLNKTEPSIRAKSAQLGLRLDKDSNHFKLYQQRAADTKKGRKRPDQSSVMKGIHKSGKLLMTDETRAKLSESSKKFILLKGHQRGMLGKKHTDKTKVILSKKSKEMWADPESFLNSKFYKEHVGQRMSDLQTSGGLRQNYSRGRQGKREDLGGLYVRSSWEANIARYLNYKIQFGNVKEWVYEGLTYDIKNVKGSRTYTPDFNVIYTNSDEIIHLEVKGWKDSKGMNKYNAFIEQYPQEKIFMIDNDEYKKIETSFAPQIKYWEY